MRCLVQRVLSASVSVSGESLGSIERGYLILLGVNNQDTEAVADKMLKKILDARLFEDEKEIVRALFKPETLHMQMLSTNIFYRKRKKQAFRQRTDSSGPI